MTGQPSIAQLRDLAENPLLGLTNPEAEQALLGALMVNNKAFDHVDGIVTAADFSNAVHGRIFAAIAKLIEQGSEASAVALKHLFDRDGALADIGGGAYLTKLIESTITIIGAPDYARTVADLARRRDIVLAAQDIVADAANADPARDANTVIDDAEQRLFDIAERSDRRGVPRALGEIVAATLSAIEDAHRRGGAVTLDTGLADVDRLISGMGAGELIVVAGRPGMGKSALAGTIAMNCARAGKRVMLTSLEMTREELAQRWIAGLSGIGTERQRLGTIERHEWDSLTEASRLLSGLPIVVDDQSRLSVPQIRQRARRARRRGGLDLLVIDHLQLIRQGGKQESRRLEIGDATSMLKAVAKELQVPVLLLSQLSRAVEQRDDKRPTLSDLRESGDIEQDADVVLLLYREEYYLARKSLARRPRESVEQQTARMADHEDQLKRCRGIAEISVAKNRHGRTGSVDVAWLAERQRFDNLSREPGVWR